MIGFKIFILSVTFFSFRNTLKTNKKYGKNVLYDDSFLQQKLQWSQTVRVKTSNWKENNTSLHLWLNTFPKKTFPLNNTYTANLYPIKTTETRNRGVPAEKNCTIYGERSCNHHGVFPQILQPFSIDCAVFSVRDPAIPSRA